MILGDIPPLRHYRRQARVGPGDNMNRDKLADFSGSFRSGLDRRLHRAQVAFDLERQEGGIGKLHRCYHYRCSLGGGISGHDRSD